MARDAGPGGLDAVVRCERGVRCGLL